MIGSLISMKFLGGKPWVQALAFWVVILVISFALGMTASLLGIILTILNIGVFICFAHYWYKLPWVRSIVVWFVAFIIDLVIVYLVFLMFPGIISYWYLPIS